MVKSRAASTKRVIDTHSEDDESRPSKKLHANLIEGSPAGEPSADTAVSSATQSSGDSDGSGPTIAANAVDATDAAAGNTLVTQPRYATERTRKRSQIAMAYADALRNRYAVSKIDFSRLSWGVRQSSTKGGRLMFLNNRKFTSLFYGVITAIYFMKSDGVTWDDRISIKVRAINPADAEIMDSLQKDYAEPQQEREKGRNEIVFSHWQTEWRGGQATGETTPFTHVFDASETFASISQLRQLEAGVLRIGDIVIIESAVVRFKDSGSGAARDEWPAWRCGFDIHNIFLFQSGPGMLEEDDDEGAEEF